ncbi:MAG TPA: hypothetical protein VGQ36_15665 [Thermoanaerobaculia bacterium]|jgi:hypothetical protein|nr:hypothetical protein [Thermoanaerobaculia bacterium]
MKSTIKITIVLSLLVFSLSAGAQSLSSTNCFLQGGICDASNSCLRYDVSQGVLVETFLGTCTVPGPIIIGGGFDPPNPPPLGPYVAFDSRSRSFDSVVAARITSNPDPNKNVPGGTKELIVLVNPLQETAELEIVTKPGGGTAFFDAMRTKTKTTVRNGNKITIHGGNVSAAPKDVSIVATKVGNQEAEAGRYDITVFTVEVETFINNAIGAVLDQKEVKANSGRRLTSLGLRRESMLLFYQDAIKQKPNGTIEGNPDGKVDNRLRADQADIDRAGHRHLDNLLAFGGIVFKGKIKPEGIYQRDFSPKIDPVGGKRESFNWARKREIRDLVFDSTGKFVGAVDAANCGKMVNDDGNDNDEDLIPGKFGTVWAVDTPSHTVGGGFVRAGFTNGILQDGETARGRYQFVEQLEYAGVRVSPIIEWHWKYAHTNPPGSALLVQKSIGGDNVVGIGRTRMPSCTTGTGF